MNYTEIYVWSFCIYFKTIIAFTKYLYKLLNDHEMMIITYRSKDNHKIIIAR